MVYIVVFLENLNIRTFNACSTPIIRDVLQVDHWEAQPREVMSMDRTFNPFLARISSFFYGRPSVYAFILNPVPCFFETGIFTYGYELVKILLPKDEGFSGWNHDSEDGVAYFFICRKIGWKKVIVSYCSHLFNSSWGNESLQRHDICGVLDIY